MSGKLPTLLFVLLAISALNQPSEAVVFFTAAAKGLFPFIKDYYAEMFEKPATADETMEAIKTMNTQVQYQLGEISKSLQNLPSIIDHVNKRNKLQDHVTNIGYVFKRAAQLKKNIEENRREDRSTYIRFRQEHESVITKDIDEIQRMLLDDTTTNYLTKNFTEGLALYENVCATRMSQLQLLEGLLAKLQIATAQYFMTKNIMYDLVLPYKKDKHRFDMTKVNLRNEVQREYNTAVRKFKEMMATASRELWRCDVPKKERDENKSNSPYVELMAFSKYLFSEGVYAGRGLTCKKTLKCPAITMVEDCGRNDSRDMCRKTRKCPHHLAGCGNLHGGHDDLSYVCVNKDKTALKRYTSLVPEGKVGEITCNGNLLGLRDDSFHMMYTGYEYCSFCQCICPEEFYYISTALVYADTEHNKVVTGARLVIEDHTIFIQIQQGVLLPNGKVDADTVEWKDIKKDQEKRAVITWDGLRSIHLTSSKLNNSELVSGFSFIATESPFKRAGLVTHSCSFDFKMGKTTCNGVHDAHFHKSGESELKLDYMDVPTKSEINEPDSKEDQFLTFTTTSMQKDGGQTTIPFIDVQEVVTNPPMPLGGAGLFHRGKKGFGGFLALKLYTYDIVDHIQEETELAKS